MILGNQSRRTTQKKKRNRHISNKSINRNNFSNLLGKKDKKMNNFYKRIMSSNLENLNVNINFQSSGRKSNESPVAINNFFIVGEENRSKKKDSFLKNSITKSKENCECKKMSSKWKRMKSIFKGIVNFFKIPTKKIDEVF